MIALSVRAPGQTTGVFYDLQTPARQLGRPDRNGLEHRSALADSTRQLRAPRGVLPAGRIVPQVLLQGVHLTFEAPEKGLPAPFRGEIGIDTPFEGHALLNHGLQQVRGALLAKARGVDEPLQISLSRFDSAREGDLGLLIEEGFVGDLGKVKSDHIVQ